MAESFSPSPCENCPLAPLIMRQIEEFEQQKTANNATAFGMADKIRFIKDAEWMLNRIQEITNEFNELTEIMQGLDPDDRVEYQAKVEALNVESRQLVEALQQRKALPRDDGMLTEHESVEGIELSDLAQQAATESTVLNELVLLQHEHLNQQIEAHRQGLAEVARVCANRGPIERKTRKLFGERMLVCTGFEEVSKQ